MKFPLFLYQPLATESGFLAQSKKINIEICRTFEEQGIAFSLPVRITHTSIDSQEKPVEVRVVAGQGLGVSRDQ